MGPLFMLIVIGILYSGVSAVLGAGIASMVWGFQKYHGIATEKAILSKSFLFPFKLLPYFLVAIIVNSFVCEFVRDVDAPLSDFWSLELGESHELLTIDTLDGWHIYPRGGGEAISRNINSFEISGNIAFGRNGDSSYYIFNTDSGLLKNFKSETQFETELEGFNIEDVKYLPPYDYYRDQRAFGDLVAFIIIMAFPLYSFLKFCNHVRKAT